MTLRGEGFSVEVVCMTICTSSSKSGIANFDVQHETVQLRFGQRIRSFLLDGVLRREHEERQVQRIGRAAGGDLVFLHRLRAVRPGFSAACD